MNIVMKLGLFAVLCLSHSVWAQSQAPKDISGSYIGLFGYDNRAFAQGDTFSMTLLQNGSEVTGSATELTVVNGTKMLRKALIRGTYDGKTFNYSKVYDGSAGSTHTVSYSISYIGDDAFYGRWNIGGASGPVLIVLAPFTTLSEVLGELNKK